jgi:hypothetical protein
MLTEKKKTKRSHTLYSDNDSQFIQTIHNGLNYFH